MQYWILVGIFLLFMGLEADAMEVEKKYVMGVCVRTSNAEIQKDIGLLWGRFFQEEKEIPERVNANVLVIYTDYEGDYTQPYTCMIGCEVASLDHFPDGLMGKEIPKAEYAVFTTKGAFPNSLVEVWQKIWSSKIPRAYTADFEIYPPNFDPQKNPEIDVYIALEK